MSRSFVSYVYHWFNKFAFSYHLQHYNNVQPSAPALEIIKT